jgi:hypothetical protein
LEYKQRDLATSLVGWQKITILEHEKKPVEIVGFFFQMSKGEKTEWLKRRFGEYSFKEG